MNLPLATAVVGSTTISLLVVLRVVGLALLLQSLLRLVAGESAREGAQETVVGFASEETSTDTSGDGSHQAAVTLLAVGVVRVAVWVVGVLLAVLVTLLAAGRGCPLLLLVGVARAALCLSAGYGVSYVMTCLVFCMIVDSLVEAALSRRTLLAVLGSTAVALLRLAILGLLLVLRLLSVLGLLAILRLLGVLLVATVSLLRLLVVLTIALALRGVAALVVSVA